MKSKGFTFIELLTVIAVILILGGVMSVAAITVRNRTLIHKAKVQISALEVALRCYYLDFGSYPPTGGSDLYNTLLDSSRGGPYIKLKPSQFQDEEIVDPWGETFDYDSTSPTHNPDYDLYSYGPDKGDDSGSDDDITNW